MQISENQSFKTDNIADLKKNVSDTKAESSTISDSSGSIDNLFGLFEDDGDYSEIVGDLIDNNHLERQNLALANENLQPLENIFEATALVDDPEMQEFFNQQIIDASSSLSAKQEYINQSKEKADSVESEASLL